MMFGRPLNKKKLLDKITSDFQTLQVFRGGTVGGTEIKYVHINCKILPM